MFYRELLINWKLNFSCVPNIPSSILSQYLWFNEYIKIDNSPIYFRKFAQKNINFVIDLFEENGDITKWEVFKIKYGCENNMFFQWIQLINSISSQWKEIIKTNINTRGILKDHSVIRSFRVLALEKLTSREIYDILITKKTNKPTSQRYFENLFNRNDIGWNEIYLLPRKATVNSYLRNFQY